MTNNQLLYHTKERYLTTFGKVIIVEIDLWLVSENKRNLYPNGWKFGWIAFDKDNPEQRILVDFNLKKGFHYHIDQKPIVKLKWISLEHVQSLFSQLIKEKFGEFTKDYENE